MKGLSAAVPGRTEECRPSPCSRSRSAADLPRLRSGNPTPHQMQFFPPTEQLPLHRLPGCQANRRRQRQGEADVESGLLPLGPNRPCWVWRGNGVQAGASAPAIPPAPPGLQSSDVWSLTKNLLAPRSLGVLAVDGVEDLEGRRPPSPDGRLDASPGCVRALGPAYATATDRTGRTFAGGLR